MLQVLYKAEDYERMVEMVRLLRGTGVRPNQFLQNVLRDCVKSAQRAGWDNTELKALIAASCGTDDATIARTVASAASAV